MPDDWLTYNYCRK